MLIGLNILNIVLIERLNLGFGNGLNILTGETGAGKSILLDALSLALGARSDVGLIRHGCENACVTAEFDTVPKNAKPILDDQGIEHSNGLILRRILSQDGKSRAWINDTPVSIKTLKSIGDTLVEIHGQFANHTLLNPATHRPTLDLYAENNITEFKELLAQVKQNYQLLYNAQIRLKELQDLVAQSESEREFLEHNIAELRTLNPQPGEEQELTTLRTNMMNAEKNSAILKEALDTLSPRGNSLDSQLFTVAHILQRVKGDKNPFCEQIDALYDIAERVAQIAQSLEPEDTDMTDMDSIEQRLFAIRAATRKHRVNADELPDVLQKMESQLNTIDNSDTELQKLKQLVQEHKKQFDLSAKKLSDARRVAATKMREKLMAELPDLKLGSADFMIEISETAPGSYGTDEVTLMIKTNPGTPFAPLHKSASGGELARLMLALRVVLAGTNDMPTFVFDEVDTGISGATASAVGARLNRLASENQALVITHSAQVAGYARRHFKISKSVTDDKTTTSVHEISADERINEIARIISGAEITPESITMAKTLIK